MTTEDELAGYIGLSRSEAEERARREGWDPVRSLRPGAIVTMEYIAKRLNFEVDDDTVRRCWKG